MLRRVENMSHQNFCRFVKHKYILKTRVNSNDSASVKICLPTEDYFVYFNRITKPTVNSFMATAATGPAWPLSWRTNKHRDRSHMIAVPSRDPDTITLYAGLDDKHVTASVCPYKHCFMESCRLEYSHTVTTCNEYQYRSRSLHSRITRIRA